MLTPALSGPLSRLTINFQALLRVYPLALAVDEMRLLALVVTLLPAAACALRPPAALTRRQCTTAAVAAAAAAALPHRANAQGSSLTDANGLYVVDPRKAAHCADTCVLTPACCTHHRHRAAWPGGGATVRTPYACKPRAYARKPRACRSYRVPCGAPQAAGHAPRATHHSSRATHHSPLTTNYRGTTGGKWAGGSSGGERRRV